VCLLLVAIFFIAVFNLYYEWILQGKFCNFFKRK